MNNYRTMNKYISRRKACEILDLHYHTIYAMANRGDIDVMKIGKQQKYNVDKYLREKNTYESNIRRNICYCRVSSKKQKGDLIRQIKQMKEKYINYEIISDIGSGLNFNRTGLKRIIDYAIKGELKKLIVTYKDRLARIGYELIENIIKEYSKGEIIIIHMKEEERPEEEITKDIISIMNVYVAKINGLRKYKNKKS
jgi:putative resolvase